MSIPRLSGDVLASWPVFWISLAANALINLLGNPQQGTATWPSRVIAVLVSQALMWGIILLGTQVVCRMPVHMRSGGTFIVILLAAGMRGVGIGAINYMLGVSTTPEFTYRVISAIVSLGTVLTIATLALASIHEHARIVRGLERQRVRLVAARLEADSTLAEQQQMFADEVAKQLTSAVESLSSSDLGVEVAGLRAITTEVIRPLAHELAAVPSGGGVTGDVEIPRQRNIRQLVMDASGPRAVSAMGLSVVLTVFASAYALAMFGLRAGLTVLIVVFAVTFFGWVVARRLLGLRRGLEPLPRRVVAFAGALLIVGAATGIAGYLAVGSEAYAASMLGTVVFIPILGVMMGLVHASRAIRDRTLVTLREANATLEWQVARTNAVCWQQQRHLARVLHGSVQAAVTAGVLRLEAAQRGGELPDDVLGEVRSNIMQAISRLSSNLDDAVDIAAEVGRLKGTWKGICEIVVVWSGDAQAAASSDPVCGGVLADLLVEACSNAVRHGGATRIRVAIDMQGDDLLRVRIHDDGLSDEGASPAGLGTAYLEDVSVSTARTIGALGSEFYAVLPLARHALG